MFYNNGWGIFGCKVVNEEDKDKVIIDKVYKNFTIKGNTLELYPDNTYTIEIEDEIEKSPKGNSYKIIKVHVPKLTTSEAQYSFLKNVLPNSQYENIIKVFPSNSGLKIVDAIKNDEIDLTLVKGIQDKTASKIKEVVVEKEEFIYLYNKLIPIGVSETMIGNIIDHYESPQTAIAKVDESLYNLCEVRGLGFKKVDAYALTDGEDKEGFKRMEACINYLIHEYANEGHSWTSMEEIKTDAVKLLDIDGYHLDVFLGSLDMVENSNIMNVHDGQITSKYYYRIEKELYQSLKRLDDNYKLDVKEDMMRESITKAEENLNITYTEEQLSVISESFKHGVYIINGSAGTGKSLLMKGITEICDSLGLTYQAVALSGRAAQLLTLKGIEASTIHRLLGYNGGGFAHNEQDKLTQDVIILEEASMANAYLWHSIVTAMKDGSKFIIVGDSGQLSGIGNGDVLRDLLQNKKFAGHELKQIHRQAQDSGIIEVAGQIREGQNVTGFDWKLSNVYGANSDLYIFTYNDKEEVMENAYTLINKKMKALDSESIMDFQILVSNKSRGELSTVSINKYCQKIYNDLSKPCIKNFNHEFRVDDKVIISGNKYNVNMYETINHYQNNRAVEEFDEEMGCSTSKKYSLFNGTMGTVVDMNRDKENPSLLVKFEGFEGFIKLTKDELPQLDLAYAITQSRSQGMTIKNVLVLLDFGAYKLLSKQLAYTAITRASDKCVVLAENNALFKAINTDSSGLRRTFVGQFIQIDN